MNDEENGIDIGQVMANVNANNLTVVLARLERSAQRVGLLQAASQQLEAEYKGKIAELERDVRDLIEQNNDKARIIGELSDENYELRLGGGKKVDVEVEWPVDANGSPVEEGMAYDD